MCDNLITEDLHFNDVQNIQDDPILSKSKDYVNKCRELYAQVLTDVNVDLLNLNSEHVE